MLNLLVMYSRSARMQCSLGPEHDQQRLIVVDEPSQVNVDDGLTKCAMLSDTPTLHHRCRDAQS